MVCSKEVRSPVDRQYAVRLTASVSIGQINIPQANFYHVGLVCGLIIGLVYGLCGRCVAYTYPYFVISHRGMRPHSFCSGHHYECFVTVRCYCVVLRKQRTYQLTACEEALTATVLLSRHVTSSYVEKLTARTL